MEKEMEKEMKGNSDIEKSVEHTDQHAGQYAEKAKKKWKWQVNKDDAPKEIYNWTLYMSIFVFGILGCSYGFDEGNIAGSIALPSFVNYFKLNDPTQTPQQLANRKGNITGMVQLGSIGGALVGSYTVDKLGRVRSLQAICVGWIVGALIQITSHSIGQLYAGRLIEGLFLGQACTIAPAYTSEVAPKSMRGLAVSCFSGTVYFGIMIGYMVSYGAVLHISDDSRMQWNTGLLLKFVLSVFILTSSLLFAYESPRWLLKVGRSDDAIKNLSKLRRLPADHPFIVGEISDINEQVLMEKEAKEKSTLWGMCKDLVMVKSIRYRFWVLAFLAQLLGQWSGATSITIYASTIIKMMGFKGTDTLKMTLVFGVVKCVCGYLTAFVFIDFLGRRKTLYSGIIIQCLTILYFAIYLTVVKPTEDMVFTRSQFHASRAALAAIYLSGLGWTMGFNCVQYLVGSEVFPLYIRSFAQSLVMAIHFANQYGGSKALPKMLITLGNNGTFFFFVGVMVVGLFWCWFFVPEVSGRSLESMEEIFNLPWYVIGRRGPQMCPDYSEINKIHCGDGKVVYEEKGGVGYVEDVESEQSKK